MPGFNEAAYENSVIELFKNMGYEHLYGPDIERDYNNPLYEDVLVSCMRKLNKGLPETAIQDALDKLKNFENGELVAKNEVFMNYIQHGVEVRYVEKGEDKAGLVYLVDYDNPDNNSFIVANQWTFIENSNKRPDVLLFLNGLPVVLVELKSPSREETDASEAYLQIRNYMQEIPSMFIYNCICVMSDQLTSKAGTITSGEDRFMEWKTKDGNYENTQYAQHYIMPQIQLTVTIVQRLGMICPNLQTDNLWTSSPEVEKTIIWSEMVEKRPLYDLKDKNRVIK